LERTRTVKKFVTQILSRTFVIKEFEFAAVRVTLSCHLNNKKSRVKFLRIFMSSDLMHTAMATWAAKDLPARLVAAQVAKLLNCSADDVAILVSAGKLRALGKPKPNAVKFFSSIELITLLADHEWLDEATKTIGQYWRRKNARRKSLIIEEQ
jgi:hypothetical protein